MFPADTLSPDSLLVKAWTENPDFDYVRDLSQPDESLLEMIMKWISDTLGELLRHLTSSDTVSTVTLFVIGILICIGAYLAWRHLGKRRGRVRMKDVDYVVSEDSIYGVDFDHDLSLALQRGQHRQAVRLLYLRTLRHLHDAGRLTWTPTQTPREFVETLSDEALREPFSSMTTTFVRIRYGHFPASSDDVERMTGWARAVDVQLPSDADEKGGEA